MLMTLSQPRLSRPTGTAYRTLQAAALIALWAFCSLAAAYRWLGMGRDYLEYLTYYNTIPPLFSFSDTRFEPGFHLLGWLFRVPLNVDYGLFSLALVGSALGAKFYLMWRYLHSPLLAALVYLIMIYPLHEYTQIRAAFAISLGLIAVHLWLEQRRVLAVVLMGVAFLFHGSIVIFSVGFIFGEFFRFDRRGLLLVGAGIAVVLVAVTLQLTIVSVFSTYNPLISKYIENATFEEEASFLSLANLFYMAMLAAALFAGWMNDRYRRPLLVMSILSVFALAVFYASPTVAQRTKEVLFGTIIFAAYRDPATERDVPALALLWFNTLALGWLSIQNGLVFA